MLELALAVAAELGMSADDATAVGEVALLHDIGKVGVPDAILRKPGGLTAPEWDVMRQHPAIGARIVDAIGSLSHLARPCARSTSAGTAAATPTASRGSDVPLPRPHLAGCDAWRAMTSDRPYRRALTEAKPGVVARRMANAGEKVGVDSPLFALVDLGRMEIEAPAPASEIPVGARGPGR